MLLMGVAGLPARLEEGHVGGPKRRGGLLLGFARGFATIFEKKLDCFQTGCCFAGCFVVTSGVTVYPKEGTVEVNCKLSGIVWKLSTVLKKMMEVLVLFEHAHLNHNHKKRV